MPYDCLIVDDERLLADSAAEYFTLLGVPSKAVYTSGRRRDRARRAETTFLITGLTQQSNYLGEDLALTREGFGRFAAMETRRSSAWG